MLPQSIKNRVKCPTPSVELGILCAATGGGIPVFSETPDKVLSHEHGRIAPHGLGAGTLSNTLRQKAAVHHPVRGGDGGVGGGGPEEAGAQRALGDKNCI